MLSSLVSQSIWLNHFDARVGRDQMTNLLLIDLRKILFFSGIFKTWERNRSHFYVLNDS